MAGSEPNRFYQKDAPNTPQVGDTWDNGAQVRIWTKYRGWVNVSGPSVETNA